MAGGCSRCRFRGDGAGPAGSSALRCSERITYHDRRHAYPGDCHGACNLFACGGSGSRQGLVVVGEEVPGPSGVGNGGWGHRDERGTCDTTLTREGASVLARARGVEGLTLLRPGPGCRGGRSHLAA